MENESIPWKEVKLNKDIELPRSRKTDAQIGLGEH